MSGHIMTHWQLAARFSLVALLLIAPVGLQADTYKVDPDHTSIVFSVAHTGKSYTYGFFRKAIGQYVLDRNPANCQFGMKISADSLDTNNAERDTHLRSSDFFDVQQFPDITFVTTRCEAANTPEGGIVYKLTGNLTIHGVMRPITLNLRMLGEGPGVTGKDYRTGFLCQIELKRSDFGMTGLLQNNMVGDAVGVTVSFEGILQGPPGAAPPTAPTR